MILWISTTSTIIFSCVNYSFTAKNVIVWLKFKPQRPQTNSNPSDLRWHERSNFTLSALYYLWVKKKTFSYFISISISVWLDMIFDDLKWFLRSTSHCEYHSRISCEISYQKWSQWIFLSVIMVRTHINTHRREVTIEWLKSQSENDILT